MLVPLAKVYNCSLLSEHLPQAALHVREASKRKVVKTQSASSVLDLCWASLHFFPFVHFQQDPDLLDIAKCSVEFRLTTLHCNFCEKLKSKTKHHQQRIIFFSIFSDFEIFHGLCPEALELKFLKILR